MGKKRTVTKYIPGEIFKFVLFDDGTAAVSTDSIFWGYIPKEITN